MTEREKQLQELWDIQLNTLNLKWYTGGFSHREIGKIHIDATLAYDNYSKDISKEIEELYKEYLEFGVDDLEVAVFPEIGNYKTDLFTDEYDNIRIFETNPGSPHEFRTKVLQPTQNSYRKYFLNVFDTYFLHKPFRDENPITYNRLIAPPGFKESFESLLIKYNLIDQRYIFLHLIAEIIEFKIEYDYLFEVDGFKYIKQLYTEWSKLKKLRHYLCEHVALLEDNPNYKKLNSIQFNFYNETITFEHPQIIYNDLIRNLMPSTINPEDFPENITRSSKALSYHNNYNKHFGQKLSFALYRYLTEQNIIPLSQGSRTSKQLTGFIANIMLLSDYNFTDRNYPEPNVDLVKTSNIVKSWILENLKTK